MLVGEPVRPSDRPPMDREMRRDDPAGPQGPPPDLRDLLSRRHRATAPAGFRPHALDQRLLGAGGAIPESLPLSFVLVLAPGGFAIQKPPASAEEMTGPAPSLKDALEAAGTMLHPYDRSSRSLLQAVDAGRMPSGLLDGIPLKYVDGAALCEVRDYRGRSERRVAAACRRYVAVLHPTAATVAADAEELCAQLDVVAPHRARYWARLRRDDVFGRGATRGWIRGGSASVPPGHAGGGGEEEGRHGGGGGVGAGEKSRREPEADAARAAHSCRRLAVEGAARGDVRAAVPGPGSRGGGVEAVNDGGVRGARSSGGGGDAVLVAANPPAVPRPSGCGRAPDSGGGGEGVAEKAEVARGAGGAAAVPRAGFGV